MRKYGGILLLAGILGAFYSSSRLQTAEPLPEDVVAMQGLRYEAGRWSVSRYACFGIAAIGALFLLIPKTR
jgi:hypothetical protein